MRSRSIPSASAGRLVRLPKELSSTLVAVRSASRRGRAESIRDVVDAYRRLYGSVQRFVLMLADAPLNDASFGTAGSHSLNQLLSNLAERAQAATFARLRDLNAAIEEARSADQLRDAIFSDTFSNDLAALRKVVAELEQLDAAFVGLCVAHVLDQHARAAAEARPLTGNRAPALDITRDITRDIERNSARYPTRSTPRSTTRDSARDSARDPSLATVARHETRAAEPALSPYND